MQFLEADRNHCDKLLPGLRQQLAEIPLSELESEDSPAIEMFRAHGGTNLMVTAAYGGLDANALDAVPREAPVDQELSLTAPHPVGIIERVCPIAPFHNGKINFTNIGEVIKESFWLCYRMAIRESELPTLPGHVLDTADKVDNLVLAFGCSGYVTVDVREQHRRACGKVERHVVA